MGVNIFQKPCPACAALLARDAGGCDCGYLFDAEEDGGDDRQQLAQEELFETYLSARLQQALVDLEAARASLAAAPTDTTRAYALLHQVQRLHQQRSELATQQEKLAALRARIDANGPAVTEAFRMAQAARAAEIVERNNASGTCMHCRAALPADGRCTCVAAVKVLADGAAMPIPVKATKS